MTTATNRNIQLQVTNTTSQSFAVFEAILPDSNSQWMQGEQAKIGQTLAAGASLTWGVYSSDANGSADAQVRLKGSGGSIIGFEMRNNYNNISLVMVELATGVNYSIQTSAVGGQAVAKAILSASI